MGSSGGGTPRAPNIPPPPANMIMPQGQTAIGAPNVPSFLPQDPTAMATGLTPEMLSAINAPAAPPMMPAAAAGTGGGTAAVQADGRPHGLPRCHGRAAAAGSDQSRLGRSGITPRYTGGDDGRTQGYWQIWRQAGRRQRRLQWPLDQRWFWRPLQRARRRIVLMADRSRYGQDRARLQRGQGPRRADRLYEDRRPEHRPGNTGLVRLFHQCQSGTGRLFRHRIRSGPFLPRMGPGRRARWYPGWRYRRLSARLRSHVRPRRHCRELRSEDRAGDNDLGQYRGCRGPRFL